MRTSIIIFYIEEKKLGWARVDGCLTKENVPFILAIKQMAEVVAQ